jgi:hypothetical protein
MRSIFIVQIFTYNVFEILETTADTGTFRK